MSGLHRRAFLRAAAVSTAVPFSAGIVNAKGTDDVDAGQEAGWQEVWTELITVAESDGAISLLTWGETWGGVGFPAVVDRFEQAFPGIAVEVQPEDSADAWLATVRQERQSGVSSFDLALVQPDAALAEAAPEGVWAPIEPLLVRPDVRDDGAWRDGFAARFLDAGGNLCFSWEYQVIHAYAVNTDLVQPGEIGSVSDLTEPRWAGTVVSSDPRLGLGLLSAAAVAQRWGNDVVRRLLVDQRPRFAQDATDLVDSLVRGRYPVALGVRPKALDAFREEYPDLGDNVAFLDLPDADFAATTPVLLFDRAPHPAAAQLFANWILTHEGQTVLTRSLPTNSARTDVEPFVPEGVGVGTGYYEPDREANFAHTAATQAFVADLLGTA